MRHSLTIRNGSPLILSLVWGSLAIAQVTGPKGYKEIGRTTEKELNVVLSSSIGTLVISKGEPEKILVVESARQRSSKMHVSYVIRDRVGYLELGMGEGHDEHKTGSVDVSDFSGGKWYLRFSNAIPVSFDIELGVGKGDFDLSGLQVKDFTLSTGASEVSLAFEEKNKATIDNINIEAGVCKFTGRNLGNADFKRFQFAGGVGSSLLDFSGKLDREVDVDIEVGLGVLTIVVPQEVGARLFYEESWISKIDYTNDFQPTADNEYVSDNYNRASGKMNIRIDSGIGSVKVRRQ